MYALYTQTSLLLQKGRSTFVTVANFNGSEVFEEQYFTINILSNIEIFPYNMTLYEKSSTNMNILERFSLEFCI